MKGKKVRKAIFTAAAIAALTGGTVTFAAAYWNGSQFHPSGAKQDLQANQVVFPGEENKTGNSGETNSQDSELWQKEENAADKDRPQADRSSGYLYENGSLYLPDGTETINLNNGETSPFPSLNGQGGTVYDLVDDVFHANLLIGDQGGSGNGLLADGSETGRTNTDGKQSSSSDGSSNQGGSGQGTGNRTDNGQTPAPSPTPTPQPSVADKIKDPEPTKNNDIGWGFKDIPYNEDTIKGINIVRVNIYHNENSYYQLYKGQQVSGKELFYALNTYATGSDDALYVWGEEAYNQYVRIDGVSFDGGKTFLRDFPVTIPKDIDSSQMVIDVSYRLSTSSNDWKTEQVKYAPSDSRIYVLSEKMGEDSETIENVLNDGAPNQCLKIGSKMNLFRWQNDLVGEEYLSALFPGWTENGELADWFYTATTGRHILEPQDMVPFDLNEYTIVMKLYWMSDSYDVGFQYSNLSYLQTLQSFGDMWEMYQEPLEVPKYVQALDIEGYFPKIVDRVTIPDTVLYINYQSTEMRVDEAWIVDEDNPFYRADGAGVLFNKAQTKMLGIPYQIGQMVVPENVEEIYIPDYNQLSVIDFGSRDVDDIPEINYNNLWDCRLVVEEDKIVDFLTEYYTEIGAGQNLVVAGSRDAEETYTVKNRTIVTNTGKLKKVLDGSTSVFLPDPIERICEGAFDGNAQATTIVLPKNDADLILEEGCFANSALTRILCNTQEQMDNIKKQLKNSGKPDISVEFVGTTENGYKYSAETVDGKACVTLLDVPEDLTEFDGTIPLDDGKTGLEVTAIGDGALENKTSLKWVILPESVTEIGSQAFKGCSALQGLFIGAKDTVVLGDGFVDDCPSLRFAASNAMTAVIESGYSPEMTDKDTMFLCPTNSVGYTDGFDSFTVESGIEWYEVVDGGETGKLLYGCSNAMGKWLVIRCGSELDGEISLPGDTMEIFSNAFYNTTGEFELNWKELTRLLYIDACAFQDSGLCGDVVMYPRQIGEAAFSRTNIKSAALLGTDTINLYDSLFMECSELEHVEFGNVDNIRGGVFYGCNKLQDITLTEAAPTDLVIYGARGNFYFNSNWSVEEEMEKLRIYVPDDAKEDYVEKWRYQLLGYSDTADQSAYEVMWDDIYEDLLWTNWVIPSDEEVQSALAERLLEGENRIRTLLGMDKVSYPSGMYRYSIEDGTLTLLGVPKGLTSLRLDYAALSVQEGRGYEKIYIGSRAFENSKNLRNITLTDKVGGIYSDAFAGIDCSESQKLTLTLEEDTPPELIRTDGEKFSFGVSEDALRIRVPDAYKGSYLEAWVYPMAGYDDFDALYQSVEDRLKKDSEDVTEGDIADRMAQIMTPYYNTLRTMLGMDSVSEDDVLSGWNLSRELPEEETETETEETETDETETSRDETETGETETDETETGSTGETETDGSSKPGTSETETDGSSKPSTGETEAGTAGETEAGGSRKPGTSEAAGETETGGSRKPGTDETAVNTAGEMETELVVENVFGEIEIYTSKS